MNREGPPLESLLRRVLDAPPEFLAEPRVGARGVVHVDAIAADIARRIGGPLPMQALAPFGSANTDQREQLALALLLCWVIADDWFLHASMASTELLRALDATAAALSPYANARAFHADPDRREELARTLLANLDCRPAGESPAQARDRLTSVSAAERERAVNAARGATARARKIREALAKKAAEESADKMWRE